MERLNKTLVVYFSHAGDNYATGNISEGNTHVVAKIIGEATGADMFEITPVKFYPRDSYDAVVEIAKHEKEYKARPIIEGDIKAEDYDIVFIGYPNWWGDMPMPVYTFLEKHNWVGKRVVPFCTHEGSGLSNTERYISAVCKGAIIEKGFAIRGNTAQNRREQTQQAVEAWLKTLK